MVLDMYKMVGSALLAFGLLNNCAYGSVDADVVGVPGEQQLISKEEKLRDTVFHAGPKNFVSSCVKIAKLIRSGVNFADKDEKGRTLLYRSNFPGVLASLLFLPDMDINSQDDEGNTVLHFMVQCHWNTACGLGFGENIEVLLACGANPHLENLAGKTARQILEEEKEIEEKALPKDEWIDNSEEALGQYRATVRKLADAEAEWTATHGK
jgi:hypothetical protein